MSRHIIRTDGFYEVVVGWDAPLQSFFAQVYDREATAKARAEDPESDEVMVVWAGAAPRAIGDLPRLQQEIAEYALIDSYTREQLMTDRAIGR